MRAATHLAKRARQCRLAILAATDEMGVTLTVGNALEAASLSRTIQSEIAFEELIDYGASTPARLAFRSGGSITIAVRDLKS